MPPLSPKIGNVLGSPRSCVYALLSNSHEGETVVGLRKMPQRRGAGGGVRACGARERERREAERAEAGDSGAARHGGARAAARDSIADGTALRCGRVGSRHFQNLDIERYRGSLFVWRCYLLSFPSGAPRISNSWGERSTSDKLPLKRSF